MVVESIPKFHGLLGVLALLLATPAGCSDDRFEGCEASRTCPPKGGESGTGSGGESGSGTNGEAGDATTGGRSSGGSGGSGGANDDPGGEGGIGGSGDDTERPTVVSFSPEDDDEDVERDIAITVTFSEPIDERSVTTSSFVLTGPDGDVSGMLSVDGNVVLFAPSEKLHLLGNYTMTVDNTVADLAGNELDGSVSIGFRVRDGRWSESTYPFGTSVPMHASQFHRNALGDIVLGMDRASGSPVVVYGGIYQAEEDRWSPARELGDGYFAVFGVAIDSAGRAVASWSGVTPGWTRTTNGDSWVAAGALADLGNVTVTSTGLATAAWRTALGFETATMDLGDGSLEPTASIELSSSSYCVPIASLDRTAIVGMTRSSAEGDALWVSWKDGSAWTQPEQVALAPQIGMFAVDSDEQGNIIIVWPEYDRVWSRIYARATESWSEELFVAATSPNPSIGFIDMTKGSALLTITSPNPDPAVWAHLYESGKGWVDSSLVRLDNATASAGVALDDAGNGIAIWAPGGLAKVRRYVAGKGWQSDSLLRSGIVGRIWAAAKPDRSITVVSATTAGTNTVPLAIRFE